MHTPSFFSSHAVTTGSRATARLLAVSVINFPVEPPDRNTHTYSRAHTLFFFLLRHPSSMPQARIDEDVWKFNTEKMRTPSVQQPSIFMLTNSLAHGDQSMFNQSVQIIQD